MKRGLGNFLIFSLVAAGAVLAAHPVGADGALTLNSSAVAAGADLRFSVSGCPFQENPTWSQESKVVLVTGTAPNERLAGFAFSGDDSGLDHRVIHVPLWVDPAEPAAVVGRCVRTDFTGNDPSEWTESTLFTFADVPVNITPKTGGGTGPIAVLIRTVAAGGQVVLLDIAGCQPSDAARVFIYEGGDLSGRTIGRQVGAGRAPTTPDGSATVELPLIISEFAPNAGDPLAEGSYTIIGACGDGAFYQLDFSPPHPLTVSGSRPSNGIDIDLDRGQISVSGVGCTGGLTAAVAFRNGTPGSPAIEPVTVTPDADGTWTAAIAEPAGAYYVTATADCGDATTDGFRYAPRFISRRLAVPPPNSTPTTTDTTTPASPATAVPAEPVPGTATFTG